MKNKVQISRLAVVCVLCTSAISGALGAASVRSLGGVGTYSGTSAAASGGQPSGAINAVRAGSMRVAPSASTGGSSAANRGTTTGRVATSPRLSIGKYLGGGTSVSGGSSIKNQKPGGSTSSSNTGGSMNPGVMAELESRIGELEGQIANVYTKADMDSNLSDKQDVLTPVDDYISIENNEIFLNVDALQEGLGTIAGKDGREIEIGSDDTHLLWRYDGDSEWQDLVALSAITGADGADGAVGPQGPAGEKGEKGDPGEGLDSSKYSTTEQMNQIIGTAIANANYVTPTTMNQALSDKADKSQLAGLATNTAVQESIINATADLATKSELGAYAKTADVNTALSGKADSGASYTKTESDSKYLTEHQSLADYAKTADVATKYATKDDLDAAVIEAGNIDLTSYAKTADVNTALDKKADVAALADYATTTVVSGLGTRVGAVESEIEDVNTVAANAATGAANALTTANAAQTAATNAATAAGEAASLASSAKSAADTAKSSAESAVTIANAAKAGLDGKADKTAIPSKVSQLENDKGYLIEHQSLADYAKTADVSTSIASATTELKNEIQQDVTNTVNNTVATTVEQKLESVQITNKQVADDAEIARSKLASDVRSSLDQADKALVVEEKPATDKVQMLGSVNGTKTWLDII